MLGLAQGPRRGLHHTVIQKAGAGGLGPSNQRAPASRRYLLLGHSAPFSLAGADVAKLEAAAAAGGKAAATKGVARSDSVLVVKNLPFSASEEELETMFGAIGERTSAVLPRAPACEQTLAPRSGDN